MKKVGLALGGGFAKGYAHIGVIKTLEKNNIPIHYIAGTSIGAIIGSLYASGLSVEEITRIASDINMDELVDFKKPNKGLICGDKIEKELKFLLKNKKFKDMKIPFAAVAINLTDKKEKVFTEGDVAKAVHASVSYPGMFKPTLIGGKEYVDGGVLGAIPVKAVRDLGATKIIAVSLRGREGAKLLNDPLIEKIKDLFLVEELNNIRDFAIKKVKHAFILSFFIKELTSPRFIHFLFKHKKMKIPHVIQILENSIRLQTSELTNIKLNHEHPDVILEPRMNKHYALAFDKVAYFIKKGEEEAERKIEEIKKLIK